MRDRRLLLFLLWVMMTVAYLDRVNISLAGPQIMASLHLTKAQFGGVLSAFQCGYALMQIPGGYLADRIGARPLLIAALLVWSAFTALTGVARSLGQMIGIRVLFGFGEGLENGAQFKLIAANFGHEERSHANGFFLSALAIGPALGSPLVTWLVGQVGWRALFYWCGLIGVGVALILAFLLPRSSSDEANSPTSAPRDVPGHASRWSLALAKPASWLAFCAYMFFNVGYWGLVYWMPIYLNTTRHINLKALGWLSAIPYAAGFCGLLAIGWLGTHTFRERRAPLIGIGYLIAAGCLFVAFRAVHLGPCLAALSGAAFFLYGGFGPFWAVAQGLVSDRIRGGFTGFVNFGGQIGGIVAPLVIGKIVDVTGSFTDAFLFMMAALFLSASALGVLHRMIRAAESGLGTVIPAGS